MKRLILSLLFFVCYMNTAEAYDPLFDADSPTDLGTTPAIYKPTLDTASNSTRWKSVRVQATASGTVTHFLIKLKYTTGITSTPVGFAVYNGTSGYSDAIGSLIARGYYANYSFGSGAGWYALPFTSVSSFTVTSGSYYHLVYLIEAADDDLARANGVAPYSEYPPKWFSDCDSPACDPDKPPGVGGEDWNDQYSSDSAPWVMGLLVAPQGLPNSISTTGTLTHGSSQVITGAEFGTKSPAAPLWWDDCEGATDGSGYATFTTGELSWVKSGYWSGSNKHYSEALPNGSESTVSNMTYRNVGYRSVSAPHSRSTKYMTGAHWQAADNNPQYGNSDYDNWGVTIDSGVADKPIWFAHFYYRVDPLWTLLNNYSNHKKTAVNVGTTMYGDQPNNYVVSQNASEGKVSGDAINYDIANITGADCTRTETLTGANALDSWVAIEQHYNSPSGRHEIWTFDTSAGGSGKKNYSDASDVDCRDSNNISRSFTVGGWFCTNTNLVEADKRGHVNNFRYADDIYIDNTFSRVMLCNSATYTSATICEPQPPTAWSASSITVTVNQGALPNGTNYLFVFDSDNVANTTGVQVTLGAGVPSAQGCTISGGTFR